MTRLIINADDFGMSEGITLGILKAHRDGVLRSTTLMVGMPFAAQAAEMAKEYPDLHIGIHFTLTAGKPVSDPKEIPSLVDEDGYFHSQDWHLKNKEKPADQDELNYDEVYHELEAQFNRFIELNGRLPDHIDSHHFSSSYPRVHEQAKKFAFQYDLPVRYTHDYIESNYEKVEFSNRFYAKNVSIEYFTNDFDQMLKKDAFEIMSHPAFVDQYVMTHSSYNVQRCKELDVLCDPRLKEWIKENNVEMITFGDLKKL